MNKTMRELIGLFESASIIGLVKNGIVSLNSPMDTLCKEGVALILIAADDSVSIPLPQLPPIEEKLLRLDADNGAVALEHDLLVPGYNDLLPEMLVEIDHYLTRGTVVKIALTDPEQGDNLESLSSRIENMTLSVSNCDIFDRAVLEQLAEEGFEHLLLLSDLECDPEEADAKTLMLLLHLRDIAQKKNHQFSITSEMLDVRNQELARVANVNDVVISSNITSLITAQISQERRLNLVVEDLLDVDGSEIYMKPARNYVQTDTPISLFTVAYAAAQRGDVFIGYKHFTDDHGFTITTNPKKSESMIFDERDLLIVISENA